MIKKLFGDVFTYLDSVDVVQREKHKVVILCFIYASLMIFFIGVVAAYI